MKKLWAIPAAAVIVAGSFFGFAAPALADGDSSPSSSTGVVADSTTQTDTQVVPAVPTPAAAPADSTATPSTPAVAPSETPAPSSQVVVPPTPVVSTDVATVAAPQVSTSFDGWDTWVISTGGVKTGPVGHVSVGSEDFPQTYLGSGQIAPACGVYEQQDHYTGTVANHTQLIAGPLTWVNGHASDQNLMTVADWTLVYGGDCPPPPVVVQPQACVVSGSFSSDEGDTPPVLTPEGWNFAGPDVHATDIYQRVSSGNLQGITHISYTLASGGSGEPAQVVIEVNPHGAIYPGGPVISFATISTNFTAGASGTLDAYAGAWSSTKIPSPLPGSLADPQPYSFFESAIPNNTLDSAPSLHLLSNSTASDISTVEAINSNCDSVDFTQPQPAPVVTVVPTTTTDCTATVDTTVTVTTTTVYVFTAGAWVLGTPVVTSATTTAPATTVECPPVVVPPVVVPPVVTPVTPATADILATPSSDSAPATTLPHTGSNINTMDEILVGGVLVAAGLFIGLVMLVRRRMDQH